MHFRGPFRSSKTQNLPLRVKYFLNFHYQLALKFFTRSEESQNDCVLLERSTYALSRLSMEMRPCKIVCHSNYRSDIMSYRQTELRLLKEVKNNDIFRDL